MNKIFTVFLYVTISISPTIIKAHSGRTNAEGCHNDRKNGGYHCHGKKNTTSLNNNLSNYKQFKSNLNNERLQDKKPLSNKQSSEVFSRVFKLDYHGFSVWVDCNKRGAIKFRYNAQHDIGNLKRNSRFYIDPKVPKECQQYSSKSYGMNHDRGHLVPANHLDYSKEAIKQSNYMTNILPQVNSMNRGAWLLTEEIIECYRDIDELLIIGGVIWGDNTENDFFVESHGITTPDAFWKVIIRNDRVISWIIPNSSYATRKRLDNYLVTVNEIERITGEEIPIAEYLKYEKTSQSWIIPYGCDRG